MGSDRHFNLALAMLKRVLLGVRVAVYGASFLALVLGIVPYLFYQLDDRYLAMHVEIGGLRIVGVVLAVAALVQYLRAANVLVSHGQGGHVEFDPPAKFVVVGPYRYARNPVAGYLLLCMLGEAIAFSSTGIFIMFCLATMLAHVQVTRIEEPLLRKRYGHDYDEYCARVPRWIPRWRSFRGR
jgi:protein-S-isoprenylcysteine O-methyltransferase Ste14